MDAEALVRPVVQGAGLELVEVALHGRPGRRVLRVVVDRPGGVDVDTIAEASERISRRLDLEGFAGGLYDLEVSSPGLERPLKSPEQFMRFVGKQVKVKTAELVDGARVHTGVLVSADEEVVVVDVDGIHRRIAYPEMASARTVVDWDAELKGIRT